MCLGWERPGVPMTTDRAGSLMFGAAIVALLTIHVRRVDLGAVEHIAHFDDEDEEAVR